MSSSRTKRSIFPSAVAQAVGVEKEKVNFRILLDMCADDNYISVSLANTIKHRVVSHNNAKEITTITGTVTRYYDLIEFHLCNLNSDWQLKVTAFVSNEMNTILPAVSFPTDKLKQLCNPNTVFNENYPRGPVKVELLLGTEFYTRVTGHTYKNINTSLRVMDTKWGAILVGKEYVDKLLQENQSEPSTLSAFITQDDKNPNSLIYMTKTEALNKNIEKMMSIERLPFDDDDTGLTKDELDAVNKINNVCNYDPETKRFSTKLLFREEPSLRNNFRSAKARLEKSLLSMKNKPAVQKGFNDVINEYLKEGIIEEVKDPRAEDLDRTDLFYLPHRVISDENRQTTKHRVVFDGSSRCPGPDSKSLNSCILCGPKLQKDILAILIRFRSAPISMISDVSKMFLNCDVTGADKDFLRFLYKDPTQKKPELKIYRFTTLVFGLTDSPFQILTCFKKLVKRKLEDPEITPAEKQACEILTNDFYIDDCTTAVSDPETAIAVRAAITSILSEGSFHIRKWVSNSPELLATIPEEDRAPLRNVRSLFGYDEEVSDTTKQLGYRYDPVDDLILFDCYDELLKKNKDDMRSVASLLASLYDPLGLLSPFILGARQILKQMFLIKADWDTPIPIEHMTSWKNWCGQLKFLSSCSFPRYVKTDSSTEYLVCADASGAIGYGCCAYARTFIKERNTYEVNLLMARSRIAPIAGLTIPRLELLAAVHGADVAQYIHEELKVDKSRIFCYTDSEIVLYWLQKKPEMLIPWVHNRVKKIVEKEFEFEYIATNDNPADIASRGCTVKQIIDDKLWRHGPDYWRAERDTWPKSNTDFKTVKTTEGIKKDMVFSFMHIISPPLELTQLPSSSIVFQSQSSNSTATKKKQVSTQQHESEELHSFDRFIQTPGDKRVARKNLSTKKRAKKGECVPVRTEQQHYAETSKAITSYLRLSTENFCTMYYFMIYRVALLLKAMHVVAHVLCAKNKGTPHAILSFEEYELRARDYWIKRAQRTIYAREYECIKRGQSIPLNSPLRSLDPFLQEGIMRITGRIEEAPNLPYDTKHQIVLPKQHPFTRALVTNAHQGKMLHVAKDTLHFNIRAQYWILQSKQLINSIVQNCIACSRTNSQRAQQQMGNQPLCKLLLAMPWMHVGIDLTGTIPIRKYLIAQKTKLAKNFPKHPKMFHPNVPTQKAYIVLFTCMSTRAIHLELVLSNHAEEFLNAFIRFVSVCGMGIKYYSDNAKYFKAADAALKAEMLKRNTKLSTYDRIKYEWHFQSPCSGAAGGMWERCIQMVKKSFFKVTRHQTLNYPEMVTVLRKITALLNDRPLCKVSEERDQVLTPSMLTIGRRINPWVDECQQPHRFVTEDLTIRWNLRQQVTDAVWKTFVDEYVVELQERGKWQTKQPNLKIGDIVLVEKPLFKKHTWPLYKVVGINPGRDGMVRSVDLYKAYEKHPYIRRSIRNVFPLEAINNPQIDFPQKMYDDKLVLNSQQTREQLSGETALKQAEPLPQQNIKDTANKAPKKVEPRPKPSPAKTASKTLKAQQTGVKTRAQTRAEWQARNIVNDKLQRPSSEVGPGQNEDEVEN